MAFTWPVNAPVTQLFGSNPSSIQPNGHTGIDFGVAAGTPLMATGAGTVVFEGWATTLSANNPWWIAPAYAGICIVIDHGNGLLSLYGHLSESYINIGSNVAQGQIIGATGNTGLSTGPHLHFEIILWPLQPYNGYYGRINPNLYVKGQWDGGTGSISPAGNVTPSTPLRPDQRKVGSANLNQRAQANTSSEIIRVIKAGTIEEFTGYVKGEAVDNNNIWYQDSQGYVWSGGFTYSGTDGLSDKTPVVLQPNQRKVGTDNLNQRSAPNTAAPIVRVIAANTTEIFTGFVRGEKVNDIDIWFQDAEGYAWAGGFIDSSTNGLPDNTPQTTALNERKVGDKALNQREYPNTTSKIIRTIQPNTKEIFTHYSIGEKIENIDIWYKDADGYAWAGGFTEQKIDGLELFKPVIPAPNPNPAPDPTPVPAKYTFEPDFDFVEVIPAAIGKFAYGDFPQDQTDVVIHQFGAVGVDTINSTINTFTNPSARQASAHFVVSGKRIVQMVSLKDRAYHAKEVGNNWIGIETDPRQDAETIASVKKLLTALKNKYGRELTKHLHKNVPGNNTNCGDLITLSNYDLPVDVTPVPQPDPQPQPDPTPVPSEEIPVKTEKEILMSFFEKIVDQYLANKEL